MARSVSSRAVTIPSPASPPRSRSAPGTAGARLPIKARNFSAISMSQGAVIEPIAIGKPNGLSRASVTPYTKGVKGATKRGGTAGRPGRCASKTCPQASPQSTGQRRARQAPGGLSLQLLGPLHSSCPISVGPSTTDGDPHDEAGGRQGGDLHQSRMILTMISRCKAELPRARATGNLNSGRRGHQRAAASLKNTSGNSPLALSPHAAGAQRSTAVDNDDKR